MASIPPRDEVIDASSAWESATEARAPPKDVMKDALKKEEQIRDIVSLQDSLRGLIARITETEASTEKLQVENEMLKQYMENLTKNAVLGGGMSIGGGRR